METICGGLIECTGGILSKIELKKSSPLFTEDLNHTIFEEVKSDGLILKPDKKVKPIKIETLGVELATVVSMIKQQSAEPSNKLFVGTNKTDQSPEVKAKPNLFYVQGINGEYFPVTTYLRIESKVWILSIWEFNEKILRYPKGTKFFYPQNILTGEVK